MDFIKDAPSENPEFGFPKYAEALAQKIVRLQQLPTVVGTFAGWGMGKTTLMRALERDLQGRQVKTLWLSAWKYNELESVRSALIVELASHIANETDAWDKATAVVRNLLWGGVKGVIRAVAPEIPFGQVGVQIATNVGSSIEELKKSASDAFRNPFEETFQELVNEYIGYNDDPNAKLVVFLDDIDRCLPSKAINVLESIKLYLDTGPLVFVVGADRQIIETAIQSMYGADVEYQGRNYLEKIIQIQFPVPPFSRKRVVDLFPPNTGNDQPLSDSTRQLLAAWSQGSPRRVIQFNNALATLEISLSQFPQDPLQRLTMDLITMLTLSHPELMEGLLRLRDRELWAEFVETFGASEFRRDRWEVRMPSFIDLHDRDPHLVSTMRAAALIFAPVATDNTFGVDKSEAIRRAFNLVTQRMTSVSGTE